MKTHSSAIDLNTDRLGQLLAARLTQATPALPHDISERLRVARQQALAQRKPLLQSRLANAQARNNGGGTLVAPPNEGLNLWSILASALPLMALLAGLTFIQWVESDNTTSELAAMDTALLTDELPPDAYADAGFVQFLKQGASSSAVHD